MNKRLNSILFLIGATVFNVLLMFFYFLALTGIASVFLPARTGLLAILVWLGLFLSALLATWYTYRWAFRVLKEKIPFHKYFDLQIFKGHF